MSKLHTITNADGAAKKNHAYICFLCANHYSDPALQIPNTLQEVIERSVRAHCVF
jgi:hypothetical protein